MQCLIRTLGNHLSTPLEVARERFFEVAVKAVPASGQHLNSSQKRLSASYLAERSNRERPDLPSVHYIVATTCPKTVWLERARVENTTGSMFVSLKILSISASLKNVARMKSSRNKRWRPDVRPQERRRQDKQRKRAEQINRRNTNTETPFCANVGACQGQRTRSCKKYLKISYSLIRITHQPWKICSCRTCHPS